MSLEGIKEESHHPILILKDISFIITNKQSKFEIIHKINMEVNEKEFIAITGPSGCGKSTLLRIIAGLIKPTNGEILLEGKPLNGPTEKITMVFQQFALLPWLTALENVELSALRLIPDKEKRKEKAMKLLEIVGLAGFEYFYPKELSGGMRQRVAIARALMPDPEIILMDEPFSNLDQPTASNLRYEILNILRSSPTLKAIIMVSHNIEEIVELADRVIILSKRPAEVVKEIYIDIPHPRSVRLPKFSSYVDMIYGYLG
ncbi:MAG TPA: ABC transporter ATP-binding protein [Geobacterales bacterium]|nr:ABC transporter ATP-binding protein [Geobacterales bacterium]